MHRRTMRRGLVALLASMGVLSGLAAGEAAAQAPVAHFIVLGPPGNLTKTTASVTAAGGTVVQSWVETGIIVATSPDRNFARSLRFKPGVQGAGASRAYAELPPEGAPAAAARSALRVKAADLEATEQRVSAAAAAVAAAAPGAAGALTAEPLEANQWDLRLIGADAAAAVNPGSRNLRVGVLDSGIEATHPDLAPNLDPANSVGCTNQGIPDPSPSAWAPTTSDHGTHVAGTIAAARNGIGVAGVAPNVRIAAVKVVDDGGFIYPEYAICGFMWAASHGFAVTNSSYFIDPYFKWCITDPDQRVVVQAVKRAVNYAAANDVVNVASLGNSNWDLAHRVTDTGSPNNGTPESRDVGNECPDIPAELPNVVGVSAVGAENRKSYYSNYGLFDADVTAPGGDSTQVTPTPDANGRVLSTIVGGGYGYKQGTSMASPHVAGVVALIRSANPTFTAAQAIQKLKRDADRSPCPPNPYDPTGDGAYLATCQGGFFGSGFYGAGLVDALAAVGGAPAP